MNTRNVLLMDRTILLRAMTRGVARWEPFGLGPNNGGEVCTNGMRYSTKLDADGCPELHPPLRAALLQAIAKAESV